MDQATPMRQDADGRPYLAYFRKDLQVAFSWAGEPGEPVEVCYGGAGEPVSNTFMLRGYLSLDGVSDADVPTMTVTSPVKLLAEFQWSCDAWLRGEDRG